MPVAVVDVFETVGVDQVKNEIPGVSIVSIGVGAQSLGYIGFDGGGEIAAIAQTGQGIGQGSFLKHEIAALQLAIEAAVLNEQQQRHQEHGGEGDQDSEVRSDLRQARIQHGSERNDGEREKRRHCQVCHPGVVGLIRCGFRGGRQSATLHCDQSE